MKKILFRPTQPTILTPESPCSPVRVAKNLYIKNMSSTTGLVSTAVVGGGLVAWQMYTNNITSSQDEKSDLDRKPKKK